MSAPSLTRTLSEIDELLVEIERQSDPAALGRARAIVKAVLDLHAAGLARVLELTPDREALERDPLVSGLLELHELAPEAPLAPTTTALVPASRLLEGRRA